MCWHVEVPQIQQQHWTQQFDCVSWCLIGLESTMQLAHQFTRQSHQFHLTPFLLASAIYWSTIDAFISFLYIHLTKQKIRNWHPSFFTKECTNNNVLFVLYNVHALFVEVQYVTRYKKNGFILCSDQDRQHALHVVARKTVVDQKSCTNQVRHILGIRRLWDHTDLILSPVWMITIDLISFFERHEVVFHFY